MPSFACSFNVYDHGKTLLVRQKGCFKAVVNVPMFQSSDTCIHPCLCMIFQFFNNYANISIFTIFTIFTMFSIFTIFTIFSIFEEFEEIEKNVKIENMETLSKILKKLKILLRCLCMSRPMKNRGLYTLSQ